jgi:hypothetical protein
MRKYLATGLAAVLALGVGVGCKSQHAQKEPAPKEPKAAPAGEKLDPFEIPPGYPPDHRHAPQGEPLPPDVI